MPRPAALALLLALLVIPAGCAGRAHRGTVLTSAGVIAGAMAAGAGVGTGLELSSGVPDEGSRRLGTLVGVGLVGLIVCGVLVGLGGRDLRPEAPAPSAPLGALQGARSSTTADASLERPEAVASELEALARELAGRAR